MVSIQYFGGFRIFRLGEHASAPLPESRAATLIAYLACQSGNPISREALIEVLWPDVDLDTGRVRLRTVLTEARKLLAVETAGTEDVLISDRTFVSLASDGFHLDVVEFDRLVDRREALGVEERVADLEAALTISSGEFLYGWYDEWILPVRQQYQQRRLLAQRELCSLYQRIGRPLDAISICQQILREDPLLEDVHVDLIRIAMHSGQPALARAQYRRLQQVLLEEFGVEPDESVTALLAEPRSQQSRPSVASGLTSPPPAPDVAASSNPFQSADVKNSVADLNEQAHRSFKLRWAAAMLVGVAAAAAGIAIGSRHIKSSSPLGNAAQHVANRQPRVVWTATYKPEKGESRSDCSMIACDVPGNTYSVGFVQTETSDVDYLVLKYSPSGELLWRRRYNGTGNDVDRARAIVIDPSGSIIVTGESDNGKGNETSRLSGLDIVTIKYSTAGEKLWERRWNSSANGEDRPVQISCSGRSGDVTILGVSNTLVPGTNQSQPGVVLLRYDASGKLIWEAHYESARGASDEANAMYLDETGVTVLCTSTARYPAGTETDIHILRFSHQGTLLSIQKLGMNNRLDDRGAAIAVGPGAKWLVGLAGPYPPKDSPRRKGLILFTHEGGRVGKVRWNDTQSSKLSRVIGATYGPAVIGIGSDTAGKSVYSLVKTDPDGYVQWIRECGFVPYMVPIAGAAITSDEDGELFVAATVAPESRAATTDVLLTKHDIYGNLVWSLIFDPNKKIDQARAMTLSGDYGILALQSESDTPELSLVKFRR